MTKTNLYLPEDQDILDELNGNPLFDYRGMAAEVRRQMLSRLQIEATLRHRKTAVDLDESNKRFSYAFLFMAIVQFLIALYQFVFDIATNPSTENIGGGFGFLASFILVAAFFYFKFDKEIRRKN